MINYINDVVIPYIGGVRSRLNVDNNQTALAIFDHFMTPRIMELLESENKYSMCIGISWLYRSATTIRRFRQ